ncbi:MAG: glycosyltransferase family 4 protein [Acidimicrobiales bacterium]
MSPSDSSPRPGANRRWRVALDATPLLGLRTGVGEFCAGAMEGLAARPDVELAAFAISWRTRQGIRHQIPAGVRMVERAMPARPIHKLWKVADLPPIEWFTGPIDVVHGTNFVVPPARRAVRVATVHDLTTLRFPEMCDDATLVFPHLLRRAIAKGAWVHTPSDFVAQEVINLLGADGERVRAVHSGIPAARAVATEPIDSLRGRPYVLALGTIEPRKDMVGLLNAFDVVAQDHQDLHLVIAGRDGWSMAPFHLALARARARARVVRLGYVTPGQRRWLLEGATVFAFPSLYEGFGFPPLEAMAAGVPVLATTAGALPEVLGSGAMLCPPGDSGALAEALSRLIDDDQIRSDLIRRGRDQARRYRWEDCGAGLAQLYGDAQSAMMSR